MKRERETWRNRATNHNGIVSKSKKVVAGVWCHRRHHRRRHCRGRRRRCRRRRCRLVTSKLKRNDEKVGLAWKLAFAQLEAAVASDSRLHQKNLFPAFSLSTKNLLFVEMAMTDNFFQDWVFKKPTGVGSKIVIPLNLARFTGICNNKS